MRSQPSQFLKPLCAAAIGLGLLAVGAVAQEAPKPPAAAFAPKGAPVKTMTIGFLRTYERILALSVLDIPPADDGLAGGTVAVADNNTTGAFMGQHFELETVTSKPGEDVSPAVDRLIAEGVHYIVTDLGPEDTLKVADKAAAAGLVVINAGATDDSLREENCRANMLHTAPTRSMLTDGLVQYLMWKQWRNWVLISGSHATDKLYAEALKNSARKFGGQILEERVFEDKGGARSTDSGQALVQRQIPVFMQGLPEHDVVLVADESQVFGSYIPWHTWVPRPVAGTAGLVPASWHPASEQWGGAQIQNRFEKAIGRRMLPKDMQVWTAVRVIGEAAARTQSLEPGKLDAFIRGPDFTVAAFKGQKLTFRDWNGQLRQPVLLGDQTSVVSSSPQEGFLHQGSELDTLGVDKPETKCRR